MTELVFSKTMGKWVLCVMLSTFIYFNRRKKIEAGSLAYLFILRDGFEVSARGMKVEVWWSRRRAL